MKPKGIRVKSWETRVKYMGTWNFKALYKELLEFLKELDYTDEDRYKYIEKFYYEKRYADPSKGKEVWIWWRTDKTDHVDQSNFYRYYIDIDYHVRYMKDVEVMREGEKTKVQHGEVEIFIFCGVELDWHGKWKNHWFLKHFFDFFVYRLWYKQLHDKEEYVKDDAMKLQRFIKDYFELVSYLPLESAGMVQPHGFKEQMSGPATPG